MHDTKELSCTIIMLILVLLVVPRYKKEAKDAFPNGHPDDMPLRQLFQKMRTSPTLSAAIELRLCASKSIVNTDGFVLIHLAI
jgi:hypothetical protein